MNDIELLNQIQEFEGETILDKILSYCEKYDKEIQEIGDILSENEIFKKTLWIDCVKNNTIQDEWCKNKLDNIEKFDEWE